ncbi:hypothetical protein DICPUDRAFT_38760, partial [Dictyostelium purpureum]
LNMNAFSNDGSFMEQFLKRQRVNEDGSSAGVGQDEQNQYSDQGYNGGYNDYYNNQQQPGQDGYNDYYNNSSNNSGNSSYPPHQQQSSYQSHTQPPPPYNNSLPPHLQGSGKPTEPTKIVWAGNVHPDSSEDEIRGLFSQFGYIQAIKIIPAKQCAFITFGDVNAAIAAQYNLNGTPIRGYPLKLGFGKVENAPAAFQQQQQQPHFNKPPHHLQEEVPTKNLWLGNIGPSVTSETLKQLFDQFGNVDNIRILVGRGCAFVNFFTVESAIAARNNLTGTMVCGMPLKINFRKEDESYKSRFGGPPTQGDDQSQQPSQLPPGRPGMRPPRPPRENQIPLPAPPPQNPSEQQIIDKFAEYVHRVGPRLETFTADKQTNNPLFSFLKPRSPTNDYYKWKLWTIKNPDTHSSTTTTSDTPNQNSPTNNNNNSTNNNNQQQSNYPQTYLTDSEVAEFKEILSSLTTSRQSITNCKNWIMAHSANALEVISLVVVYFQDNQNLPFPQKLNILHVLNDCLHNSSSKRPTPDDWVSDEFARNIKEYLPFIVGTVASNEPPENQEKVFKVLLIWENQKFYDTQFIDSLKSEATDEENE